MSVDELMTDEILGRKNQVTWEQRDKRSVPEVARERISKYFSECPDYNTPSVFVRYQVSPEGLGFWNRLRRRNPVFEDWVFQGENDGIKVTSWGGGKNGKSPAHLDDYLTHAQSIELTFMFGTHYNGNCVIDWNAGSSRIGKTPSGERDEE